MNKYEDLWYSTEGSNKNDIKIKYSLKFYKYTLKYIDKKTTLMFYKKMKYNVPHKILGDFSLFDNKLKSWIKNNILNNLNEEKIVNLFIQSLNNSITENDDFRKKLFINSFREMGIVKSVEIDKDNIIKIVLNNGEEYKLRYVLKNVEDINAYSNQCHHLCYLYFQKNKDSNANAVFMIEKDLFNRNQYHSFIVRDGLVFDYARNIAMEYESYKKLFKPEIIFDIKGKDMMNDIQNLEEHDKEFNELKNWQPVFKYGLYNILNKEKTKKYIKTI